jgi:hypothetical protein
MSVGLAHVEPAVIDPPTAAGRRGDGAAGAATDTFPLQAARRARMGARARRRWAMGASYCKGRGSEDGGECHRGTIAVFLARIHEAVRLVVEVDQALGLGVQADRPIAGPMSDLGHEDRDWRWTRPPTIVLAQLFGQRDDELDPRRRVVPGALADGPHLQLVVMDEERHGIEWTKPVLPDVGPHVARQGRGHGTSLVRHVVRLFVRKKLGVIRQMRQGLCPLVADLPQGPLKGVGISAS